jgi:hypothetical protein
LSGELTLEGAIDLSEDRLRAVVDLVLFIPINEGKIAGLFVPGQMPRNSTILIPVVPSTCFKNTRFIFP